MYFVLLLLSKEGSTMHVREFAYITINMQARHYVTDFEVHLLIFLHNMQAIKKYEVSVNHLFALTCKYVSYT